ncbi:MAG: deaminase [Candidatus Tagabacteria bacterium]
MKKIIILYVPVLHQGYIDFFKKKGDVEIIFVIGENLISEFMSLHKEIRQIDPVQMALIIEDFMEFPDVRVLDEKWIKYLQKIDYSIITANDAISLGVVEKYFPDYQKEIDSVFLRWDEKNVNSQYSKHDRISTNKFDRSIIETLEKEAEKSSDWWRHVGAAIVKNGKIVLITHNRHVPSEHIPYVFGDPRDFIKAGESPHIRTSLHAEHGLIVEAARQGIKLDGCNLYTTVFPCSICAKSVAYAGIKNLFFKTGHASLDSYEILKSKKIEVILVK